ncbi:MAG: TIGR00730 family Rossman fold protein [Anaerolineales bacterium]
MNELRSICVFCGSGMGNHARYREAAVAFGQILADERLALVYGGGSTGLMGVLADSVLEHDGKAIGIIPEAMTEREVQHRGLTELHIVDSMHTRKAMMARLSDAFVALPGGIGTLEELLEITTWAQLGIHRKPIAILNLAGYYNPLLAMIQQGVDAGFIRRLDPQLLQVAEGVADILPALRSAPPPDDRPKWLDLEQS